MTFDKLFPLYGLTGNGWRVWAVGTSVFPATLLPAVMYLAGEAGGDSRGKPKKLYGCQCPQHTFARTRACKQQTMRMQWLRLETTCCSIGTGGDGMFDCGRLILSSGHQKPSSSPISRNRRTARCRSPRTTHRCGVDSTHFCINSNGSRITTRSRGHVNGPKPLPRTTNEH